MKNSLIQQNSNHNISNNTNDKINDIYKDEYDFAEMLYNSAKATAAGGFFGAISTISIELALQSILKIGLPSPYANVMAFAAAVGGGGIGAVIGGYIGGGCEQQIRINEQAETIKKLENTIKEQAEKINIYESITQNDCNKENQIPLNEVLITGSDEGLLNDMV